jgi:hypothetical protein
MSRWSVIAVMLLAGIWAPVARAEPSPTPDLTGYQSVDVKAYDTYYEYPTTNGVQFIAPGGYKCRITYTGRANPPFRAAECWGALPGTSFNSVWVFADMKTDPARFDNGDLTKMETYHGWQDPTKSLTISPDAYKPLPSGSKLTYPVPAGNDSPFDEGGTCAVTAVTTICVLGDHGFVLDPKGSRAF